MRFPRVSPLRALGGLALCILVGAGGYALAQVNQLFGPLGGQESIEVQGGVGGPGGQSYFTTSGRISNGRSYAYFTAFPTASFTIGQAAAPTGTTVSTANMSSGGALLFNVTNGSAITITLPPIAQLIDGEIIEVCNVTAAAWATNAVTVAANTGQTIVGTAANNTLTTLAASTCNKWIWGGATAANWYAFAGAGGL